MRRCMAWGALASMAMACAGEVARTGEDSGIRDHVGGGADGADQGGPWTSEDVSGTLESGSVTCVPQCEALWCGHDDGCGGRCLRCPDGATCNTTTWLCECPGTWCGEYTCCGPGERCGPLDECVPCVPDCEGKECGDDGCGGTCGTCDVGATCVDFVCRLIPKGSVGQPCSSDAHCQDVGGVCYPEVYGNEPTGFIGGYCLVFHCTSGSCPLGSDCFQVLEGGGYACLATCETLADCPRQKGYACIALTVTGGKKVCWPDCSDADDCPSEAFCDTTNEFCVPDAFGCSPSNPTGYCPGELVCQGGACQPYDFSCTDQTYEPNETVAQAITVSPGIKEGLQICLGDQDWFRMDIPAGHSGTLGMYFNQKLGDLDLCVFDGAGKLIGCRYLFEHHPASWRKYDWNDEYLSVFAAAGARTVFFRGDGWNGARNNYLLDVRLTPWRDGPDCQTFFDPYECTGCDPITKKCEMGLGKINLKQFPFPDAADPYVGDGYVLEHSSSYRWLRREVIMAIRHAIHEVQARFPGTKPLGLLDMGQIDGGTPGFDVGHPRHPETTHDQGGNIDVAYYQTGINNLGRVICDPIGGSHNGAYCTNVENHVVDLPRTAYFLAQIADNPRFRVAGVDQMIAPLLLEELKKQRDLGWISLTAYNRLKGGALAYGSGWPYHHHHIHISFKWWSQGLGVSWQPPIGCGFRMPGDQPWPVEVEAGVVTVGK